MQPFYTRHRLDVRKMQRFLRKRKMKVGIFRMIMNKALLKIARATLTALIVIGFACVANAQKGRSKTEEKLKILEKLPEFFINDEFMPSGLKRLYRRDAARIALRLVNKEQRLSSQTVEIPKELTKSIYNALVAVRVSDYSVIDTIAAKYNIRTFGKPAVNTLTLVFEHDAAWAKPIKQYRSDTTASKSLNFLFKKYNLQITKLVNIDEERAGLVLQAREPINVSALARRFFVEEGIASVEEMLPYGDGNDIDMELTPEGWLITYSVKFGECLLECKKIYQWQFRVGNTGKVEYLGGKGDTIPPWVGAQKKRVEHPDDVKPKGAPVPVNQQQKKAIEANEGTRKGG